MAKLHPDVVIMDINIPQMDGFAATGRITERWPEIAVIGLTMHEDGIYHDGMRKVGAVECVAKMGPSEDLIRAIRAAAKKDSRQNSDSNRMRFDF